MEIISDGNVLFLNFRPKKEPMPEMMRWICCFRFPNTADHVFAIQEAAAFYDEFVKGRKWSRLNLRQIEQVILRLSKFSNAELIAYIKDREDAVSHITWLTIDAEKVLSLCEMHYRQDGEVFTENRQLFLKACVMYMKTVPTI